MKQQNNGITPQDAEAMILKDSDNVLEQRLLAEFAKEEERKRERLQSKPKVITEFSQLDEKSVFSPCAHYKLFNRDTKSEFFINGRALESKIGLNHALYEKVKSRKLKAFSLGNQVVMFYRYVTEC